MSKSKTKRVLVFGVFDLLHPGHMAFLREAAKHGEVTVVVTRDEKAAAEKGRPPFFTEQERLEMVASLKGVAHAELGDKGARWTAVSRLAPDVICVGHDQDATHPKFLAQVAGLRKPPRIVQVGGLETAKYSSSRLKLEIHRTHEKA
ncbi:MAG TPA: adenylyltransferase/cytidyltransferase family protein [Candidatus Binatia bacterium]|jgi:FAD synthetase|nr:adenylyltransferase/cytidyltransferase family protein [Candidatus Binatia bacterium]